jgi:hypothetical protein
MDEYFEDFLVSSRFGPALASRPVPPEKIAKFKGKLPDKLLEYWHLYGWCGYADGLFWTVDPDEWEDELEDWIGDTDFMERDAYHVIGRTAFGELILWGEKTGQSIKVVTSWGMIFPSFDPEKTSRRGPDLALQMFFAVVSRKSFDTQDEKEEPLFQRALAKLGPLDHNTMYGYVPALALGGKAMLDNLQKLDAHVHLNIIAQVTERKIMRDIGKDARDAGLM